MQKLVRATAAIGALILVLAVTYVFVVRPDAQKQSEPGNQERTLLVQFRDSSKFSELNFVVADAGKKWFYIPSNLVFETDPSIETLGTSAQGFLLRSSLNGLNETNGIEIDDVWQIDEVAFASLVEAADGVEILIPEKKTLDGFAALNYVFGETSNPKIILQRFKIVWRQLINSFGSSDLVNILTTIGSSSRSTIQQAEFAGYLEQINRHRKEVVFKKTKLNSDFSLTVKSRQRLIDAGVRERLAP